MIPLVVTSRRCLGSELKSTEVCCTLSNTYIILLSVPNYLLISQFCDRTRPKVKKDESFIDDVWTKIISKRISLEYTDTSNNVIAYDYKFRFAVTETKVSNSREEEEFSICIWIFVK